MHIDEKDKLIFQTPLDEFEQITKELLRSNQDVLTKAEVFKDSFWYQENLGNAQELTSPNQSTDEALRALAFQTACLDLDYILENYLPSDRREYTSDSQEHMADIFAIIELFPSIIIASPLFLFIALRNFFNKYKFETQEDFRKWNSGFQQAWGQGTLSNINTFFVYPYVNEASAKEFEQALSLNQFSYNALTLENQKWLEHWNNAGISGLIYKVVFNPNSTVADALDCLRSIRKAVLDFSWVEFKNTHGLENWPAKKNIQSNIDQGDVDKEDDGVLLTRLKLTLKGTKRSQALDYGEVHTTYIPTWIPNTDLGLYDCLDYVAFIVYDSHLQSGDLITDLTIEKTICPKRVYEDMQKNSKYSNPYTETNHPDVSWEVSSVAIPMYVHRFWENLNSFNSDIYELAQDIYMKNIECFGWGNADPADAIEEIARALIINGIGESSD